MAGSARDLEGSPRQRAVLDEKDEREWRENALRAREGREWGPTHPGHPFTGGGSGRLLGAAMAAAREAGRAVRDLGPKARMSCNEAMDILRALAFFFALFAFRL